MDVDMKLCNPEHYNLLESRHGLFDACFATDRVKSIDQRHKPVTMSPRTCVNCAAVLVGPANIVTTPSMSNVLMAVVGRRCCIEWRRVTANQSWRRSEEHTSEL